MKFKTSASLMIAVVLGIVTAYVGLDVVRKAKAGAGNATKIVVAARDMEPGYVIEASDLKLEDVPATLVPVKAFKDQKLVVGRTVVATVVRGYPLIDNQLAAAGSGAGMQAMVPRGMRAVAVEVSESSAVAGLITPGCYVDVIATFNNGEQTIATTVVQNVKVQFVQRSRPPRSSNANAQTVSASAGTPELGAVKTVTLIVTPKQANAIELATNQGKPRLVLRGMQDDTDTADSTLRQNELLGIPDPPPPATQPAPIIAAVPESLPIAPPAPPIEREMTDAFQDAEALPIAPPVNRRPVYIIRGGEEQTIYFEENGDRAMEETAAPQQQSQRARQRPTTRPQQQQPRKSAADQELQQQEPQQQPQKHKGADGAGEPRTASGVSPGDPAPRAEQGQRNLRRGM
jgi:Flp pilus assembly protein CpaB